MSKYNYNKHRTDKEDRNFLKEWHSDVHIVDYAGRLETVNETRRRYGHHAAGITIGGDTIDFGQIRQAGAPIRSSITTTAAAPTASVPMFADSHSSGIEPSFSNVYRRRNDATSDYVDALRYTIDRLSDPTDPGPRSGWTDEQIAQRNNSERSRSNPFDQSVDATELRNRAREIGMSESYSEEPSARRFVAQLNKGDRDS